MVLGRILQISISPVVKSDALICFLHLLPILPRGALIDEPAGSFAPAAGVTLTTALASLLTGKAVDTRIAMTGEVALRGAVTAIGGLPEKLMAAQRAGITKVFIPEGNLYELKDVAEEVQEKIEIVPVSSVQ